jgi:predicted dinucleotide-binding enzyme
VKVAVLGAGVVGRTLAAGWATAGHDVVLGSRDPSAVRTQDAVREVGHGARAEVHRQAAAGADAVVVTVPGDQVPALITHVGDALAGRTVVDATNNLSPEAPALNAVAALSAAGGWVYRAFNSVGWEQMRDPVFGSIRSDMLFAGPEPDGAVAQLIADLGFRPIWLGDGPQPLAVADSLARLWFTLAFQRGLGRRVGFRVLTAEDDS